MVKLSGRITLFCVFALWDIKTVEAACPRPITITNLDDDLTVNSSVNVGDNLFRVDVNENKGYPLTLVTNTSYFGLSGGDLRDVEVTSCLVAGVTHALTIQSDSTNQCASDTGILRITVDGTAPVYSVPASAETIYVTGADVIADQVTVHVITITNTGACTTFICDVICTNAAKGFNTTGNSITTAVSDLTYNFAYALNVSCYDTNAEIETSVTKSFDVIFILLTTSTSTSTTSTSTTSTSTRTTPTSTLASQTTTTSTSATTQTTSPSTTTAPATSASTTTRIGTKANGEGFFDQTSNVIAISTIGALTLAGIGVTAGILICRRVTGACRVSAGAERRNEEVDEEVDEEDEESRRTASPDEDRTGSPASISSQTGLVYDRGAMSPISLVDLTIGEHRQLKYCHWNDF